MKYSESWLREWVNPDLNREKLANMLTMAGLEVEDIQSAASNFTNVVIGEICEVGPHPNADLHLVSVKINEKKPLQIVCGARNVAAKMKVAVAKIDAQLPHGKNIQESNIKGIISQGMLCSAKDLGLAEESETIIELPSNAKIGQELWQYLALADHLFDISITPNRGDCLSVKGLAREVSALTQSSLTEVKINKIKPQAKEKLTINVKNNIGAPNYVGRIIKDVQADATSPVWLTERLRRSGVRSISPIVDVTNYVMLELGQPMHAFDLDKINQSIHVRHSKAGEEIVLLDGSTKTLDDKTMLIADNKNPLAIAGVMGGLESGVTLLTKNIFLESAYFVPQIVARQRQFYNLDSESAYRFERGIDPTIQELAIERATDLILQICGGLAGPIVKKTDKQALPRQINITLPKEKISKVLGVEIASSEIESILKRLQFTVKKTGKDKNIIWKVIVPSFRSDITIAEDLIEEIARVYGYNKIPAHKLNACLFLHELAEDDSDFSELRKIFCSQGYQEIISYSFINKKLQKLFDPRQTPDELINPISSDMAVMRTNLWPGLITTLKYNLARQKTNVRLFELGTCFIREGNHSKHVQRIAGVMTGTQFPEQWGITTREVDFYDLKGHLEHVIGSVFSADDLVYEPVQNSVLHPKQSAEIYVQGKRLGVFGQLHPVLLKELDLDTPIFLFEFDLNLFKNRPKRLFKEISKFPEIRRDLAMLVNEAIPAKDIQDTIRVNAGGWLKDVFIFDVYQGKGISPGLKSIALAVILQHPARTLIDTEVAELMERVVTALKEKLGAELRS